MRKRAYKLSDIEKILTYVPPIFILFLAILSAIIAYFVLEYRQNSKIELLKQEQRFINQKHLNNYINSVDFRIKNGLESVQQGLTRSVHTLEGISIGLAKNNNIQMLKPYIDKMEKENNINFVIFDKELHVLHGLDMIRSIEKLIFNEADDQKHLEITLLYILSQGKSSSMSWKNDSSRTIQLSHFERSEDAEMYIGAFSSIDDLSSLTLKAYIESMRDGQYEVGGYYCWLYDISQRKVYNLNNQKRWQISRNIDPESLHEDIGKYFLSIGITQDAQAASYTLGKEMSKIKDDYRAKKRMSISTIVVIGFIFIAFTVFFSEFIKDIFGAFNRRAARKNQQISALKDRYELAIIASNDGLWDTNFITKKTFFSKKWLDMLGYQRGDIRTYDDWLGLVHNDDRKELEKAIREHVHGKNSDNIIHEYRIRLKSGKYIWVLGRGKVFVDKKGDPLRLTMMSMDIEEKKQASKKLNELVKKEVAKNQKKQKLLIQQNKMAAMGEMIGVIAHQWRQPLNNISLIIHFIRDNIKSKEFVESRLDEYVDRAKKQIAYMSDTIDDFRDFYKPSKSKERFDIKEAIESTLSILNVQIDKMDIGVELIGESRFVTNYENEFKQAVLNILSNAKDAIFSQMENKSAFNGKITVTIEKNKVTIYNNGGHADTEVLERMFEPYFTTKFEDKGTGIGLYMTRAIIEDNMGGTIRAKNIDDGVVFIIKGIK